MNPAIYPAAAYNKRFLLFNKKLTTSRYLKRTPSDASAYVKMRSVAIVLSLQRKNILCIVDVAL
jgi:hypothetical protein